MSPKIIFAIAFSLSLVLCPLLSVNLALADGYPSWTNFSYIDWNPGNPAAIPGTSGNRHYDNRVVWDGTKFITIQGMNQGAPSYYSLWSVASFQGQTDWGTPVALDVPRSWNIAHHALACDPDGFPPTDTVWSEESGRVRFKLWWSAYGDFDHFRYSESTDGIYWYSILAYSYCPPSYKVDPNKNMIKPDVLYRPQGSPSLDLANPMDNRYICYLGANNLAGDPGYYEMYISSNGLDWKIYAWDSQCQSRWSGLTEISDFITFTGYSSYPPSATNVDSFEEVYENGVRQGFMLWTDNYTYPIHSYYSTNGVNWISREEQINTIGGLGGAGAWNASRNYGFDSVRLGESYFILRNGLYNTGAAIRKGPMSAEVDTPANPSGGNITIDYRLFHWNAESCPDADFTFSTDGTNWNSASQGGGDTSPYLTGIGGYSHTFTWNSLADLPTGAPSVYFRVQPDPIPETGAYDTTDPFVVSQAPTPTPTVHLPTPTLPPPTPTASPVSPTLPPPSPTPSPSCSPAPTLPPPTPTPFHTAPPTPIPPTPTPSPSSTPSPFTTATPSPSPSCGPKADEDRSVISSGDFNGDGAAEIAVFRPSNGLWSVQGLTRVYFGGASDYPAPGDFRGDGTASMAIFRPSDGLWSVRGLTRFYYGLSGDLPVPGDYNGDGSGDLGVFRESSGQWLIRNVTRVYFGRTSDWPAPGDYRGDGSLDIAVFRPISGGLWAVKDVTRFYYGLLGDWPVPADYLGDGTGRAGIFRAGQGLWALRDLTRIYYGNCQDIPRPADYDGNNIDDYAIFRPPTGLWSARNVTRAYFGIPGDIPVTR